VDKNGISSLITSFKNAFGLKQKNNHTIIHKNETFKNNFNGGGSVLKNIIAPLGTNAFIATGLLIILEKVFNKEKLEKKTDKIDTDKISKLKKGGTKNKDFQKLVDVITPLSFNIFANKSFIQTLLKEKQDKQIKNNIKNIKLSGGRGLPLPGFTGHSFSGLGSSGLDLNNLKGGKKISKNSKTTKIMKGGEESWGATGMPSQFYDPKTELVSYPFNSGIGVKTAYGLQEPLDVGRGMLAPNTTSKSISANIATSMKTGGTKKISKISKNSRITKITKIIKKKIMKGGEESWGATGMPSQFYDPKTELVSYPFNSGIGVKTAYGLQEPLDVGRGMLAPNTTSKSISANIATSMKTGGAKKISKISRITKTTKTTKTAKINNK